MKVSSLLKAIDTGWVRKPQGFRIVFEKQTEAGMVVEQVPVEAEAPFDSDVTAWRAAWKLAQAARPGTSEPGEGSWGSIRVVDDQGEPVVYYISNRLEVFNPSPGAEHAQSR